MDAPLKLLRVPKLRLSQRGLRLYCVRCVAVFQKPLISSVGRYARNVWENVLSFKGHCTVSSFAWYNEQPNLTSVQSISSQRHIFDFISASITCRFPLLRCIPMYALFFVVPFLTETQLRHNFSRKKRSYTKRVYTYDVSNRYCRAVSAQDVVQINPLFSLNFVTLM